MYIDLTEKELAAKLSYMWSNDIVIWLQEEGLTLKKDFPPLERGVYRRKNGLDLIEYNGSDWIAFNPVTVGRPIAWATVTSRSDSWVNVLSPDYTPVVDGLCVQFSRNGERTG